MSKYIVYALVDPRTDQIRYIGKSCSGLKRPNEHFCSFSLKHKSKKNSWLKSLLKKNLRPNIKILQECIDTKAVASAEIYWIEKMRSQGVNLTNMTKSGTGGKTSDGTHRRKPVIGINLKTKEEIYIKGIQLSSEYGFLPTKVSAVCLGKRKSHKGYFFYYAKEKKPILPKYKTKQPVVLISRKTKNIYKFDMIKEAAEWSGYSQASISNAIRGKTNNKKYIIVKSN